LNLPRDAAADLRSLGEAAFFRYPVQLSPEAASLVTSEAAATFYGFWLDADHGVGGLVRVALASGRVGVAYSCATCHAAIRDGRLVVGLGNDRLDLGLLALGAHPRGDPILADRLARWGPGRLDVSSRDGSEPVRFPDLRATRLQAYLQADATVSQRDLVSLAIRLETLIITAHGGFIRPPRQVTLALADYLWSLSESVEGRAPRSDAERRGAALFGTTCAGCHKPPSFTGPPVPLASVGTDETLGDSPDRGTGLYRVPSLRGVSARGLLLHDGALPSLPSLLDPARLEPDFAGGVRPGRVEGHPFGLNLPRDDRADLIAYLETL
jgi:cytochrome c2